MSIKLRAANSARVQGKAIALVVSIQARGGLTAGGISTLQTEWARPARINSR
jgi:hypothetical protein